MNIKIDYTAPSTEEYLQLRVRAGLSAHEVEAVAKGLKNSYLLVCLRHAENSQLLGFGRVVGDGGMVFQIADLFVDPIYQGVGLGGRILTEITAYLDNRVPSEALVSLSISGASRRLYQRFGFADTTPITVGMMYQRNK